LNRERSPEGRHVLFFIAAFIAGCIAVAGSYIYSTHPMPALLMIAAGSTACYVVHRTGSFSTGVDFILSGEVAVQSIALIITAGLISAHPAVIFTVLLVVSIAARLYLFHFLSLRSRELAYIGTMLNAVLFIFLFYLAAADSPRSGHIAHDLVLGYGALHTGSYLLSCLLLAGLLTAGACVSLVRVELSLFLHGPSYLDLADIPYGKAHAAYLAAVGALSACLFFCAGWLAAPLMALLHGPMERGMLKNAGLLFACIAAGQLLLLASDFVDAYIIALAAVCVSLARFSFAIYRGTGVPA
jgi:hypothetical protein